MKSWLLENDCLSRRSANEGGLDDLNEVLAA